MSEFKTAKHRVVLQLLKSLNGKFLEDAKCYFGGATRIVLELDEYRESMDLDFLCADREGYRILRNTISQQSLGEIFSDEYQLIREVRADMYGIRTFLKVDDHAVKFEIISEGRIFLAPTRIETLPVEVLDRKSSFAEKFLANTDRGRDKSTRSRDLIDLAFMSATWEIENLQSGFALAKSVYGASVTVELEHTLDTFEDLTYRAKCIKDLSVTNTRRLKQGLISLGQFIR